VELDHVFVMCDVGAPEATALLALGLREGSPNTHPGQGTACRRFFFEGSYLELVWVTDVDQARHAGRAPARLLERWIHRRDGASPFGLVLRGGDAPDATGATWPMWVYRAPYLSVDQPIEFAEDAPLEAPEIIVLPWLRAPARAGLEPLAAPDLATLRSVECVVTSAVPCSLAVDALHHAGIVQFLTGPAPMLTMTFGTGSTTAYDLRPALPVLLQG
jgi:hypothetical protein